MQYQLSVGRQRKLALSECVEYAASQKVLLSLHKCTCPICFHGQQKCTHLQFWLLISVIFKQWLHLFSLQYQRHQSVGCQLQVHNILRDVRLHEHSTHHAVTGCPQQLLCGCPGCLQCGLLCSSTTQVSVCGKARQANAVFRAVPVTSCVNVSKVGISSLVRGPVAGCMNSVPWSTSMSKSHASHARC